jgi:uncharacterized integral membrane protein
MAEVTTFTMVTRMDSIDEMMVIRAILTVATTIITEATMALVRIHVMMAEAMSSIKVHAWIATPLVMVTRTMDEMMAIRTIPTMPTTTMESTMASIKMHMMGETIPFTIMPIRIAILEAMAFNHQSGLTQESTIT